jgi:transcriptional regulator with XRE-family HTH domain
VEVKESSERPLTISEAVKKFRLECGQTQVEFAVALGMAPTSIHRYEAGSSVPDFPVLKKLLDYALKRKNASAQEIFLAEVGKRMGLQSEGLDASLLPSIGPDPLSALEIEGQPLSNDERLKIVGLVLLLRHSSDPTTKSVVDAVLKPWLDRAHDLSATTGRRERKRKSDKSS